MRGKSWIAHEEIGRGAAYEQRGILRRVNGDARVRLQDGRETARVVSMTVRDDDGVESLEVDAERLHVGGKDPGVVSGVEQDALASVFDERRETPVPLECRRLSESVIENGNPLRLLGAHRNCGDEQRGGNDKNGDASIHNESSSMGTTHHRARKSLFPDGLREFPRGRVVI